jgi:hypothetical protein
LEVLEGCLRVGRVKGEARSSWECWSVFRSGGREFFWLESLDSFIAENSRIAFQTILKEIGKPKEIIPDLKVQQ